MQIFILYEYNSAFFKLTLLFRCHTIALYIKMDDTRVSPQVKRLDRLLVAAGQLIKPTSSMFLDAAKTEFKFLDSGDVSSILIYSLWSQKSNKGVFIIIVMNHKWTCHCLMLRTDSWRHCTAKHGKMDNNYYRQVYFYSSYVATPALSCRLNNDTKEKCSVLVT